MRLRRSALALAGLTLLAMPLAACGDDSDSADDTTTTTPAPTVEITGAWARTSPASATNGAAYMQLTASTDDALLSASVDPSVAAKVEVHETVPADETDTTMGGDMTTTTAMGGDMTTTTAMGGDTTETTMGGDDMGDGDMGAMTMRPVDRIDLPAGESVSLEPGGYHVMLLDLAKPLEAGETIEVTLTFEQAGEQTVQVPVRDDAP